MSYGGMFNDRSLLQYGFLIEDPDPPHVFGADRHDYDVGDPWSNQHFMEELPAPFDAGGSLHLHRFGGGWGMLEDP
jgi:hypothetical protein